MGKSHSTKDRCQAMIDAGIEDPNSQAGKDFCTDNCPYEKCIVYESNISAATRRGLARKQQARNLRDLGYSAKTISDILGVSVGSVKRYFK